MESKQTVVDLRGLTKVFRDFWMRPRVTAVQDLDLSVRKGEVVGLLGPNGSGKSTTIKMILGLLFPTSGRISLFGKPPTDVSLKKRVGYLPEDSNLFRFLNAVETLDFYGRLFHLPPGERRRRTEMLLGMVGLEGAMYRPIGEYSKGMQRRMGLAQALVNDPDLLILDEPTTGMDPIATRQMKDLIRHLHSRGKTIILCTHLLGEVEDVCTRLVIMYGGRIRAQGSVDELLAVRELQNLEVEPLRSETIEKIDELIQKEENKTIRKVETPRMRLETLFLNVVEKAEKEGLQTSGATTGKRGRGRPRKSRSACRSTGTGSARAGGFGGTRSRRIAVA
jgi:ABC-2 type transport system ATP-binding protein